MNELHSVLKQLREENKKTQKEVAEVLKISQQTYSNYETGAREPSIDLLIELADYYKTTIDILVGRYTRNK